MGPGRGNKWYAIQCWSAMQNALKIFPCSIMSMMSNEMLPAACEVDVMGAVAMYAMQIAGEGPRCCSIEQQLRGRYRQARGFPLQQHGGLFHEIGQVGPNAMAIKGNPYDSCFCTLHGTLRPARSDSLGLRPMTSREESWLASATAKLPTIRSTPSAQRAW